MKFKVGDVIKCWSKISNSFDYCKIRKIGEQHNGIYKLWGYWTTKIKGIDLIGSNLCFMFSNTIILLKSNPNSNIIIKG